ncbi:MAG TPA: hypothetical protein VNU25_03970 [Candidatus Paceibacterota bacterium]|nr:hypothetical protein [Candidatus Paceibacterota bacterium]
MAMFGVCAVVYNAVSGNFGPSLGWLTGFNAASVENGMPLWLVGPVFVILWVMMDNSPKVLRHLMLVLLGIYAGYTAFGSGMPLWSGAWSAVSFVLVTLLLMAIAWFFLDESWAPPPPEPEFA